MKTTVQVLLCTILCLSPFLNYAQIIPPGGDVVPGGPNNYLEPQYPDDELLVAYLTGTTESQKQAVRDRYDVVNFTDINGILEVWSDIDFPVQVEDVNGLPVILYDVGEMLFDLDLQNNGTSGQTDERAQIDGGDYNYHISLPPNGAFNYGGSGDFILPYCPSSSYRLIGTTDNSITREIPVVILDQTLGGNAGEATTHADRVVSVIDNTAGINALAQYRLISQPIFDNYGTSNYVDIILAFKWLVDNQITDGIINMSASMPVYEDDFSSPILNYMNDILETNNLLLVSSAGNDGLTDGTTIFPGSGFFANEITVAGTENCFTDSWSNTNANRELFEIAAEAKDVLVPLSHPPSGHHHHQQQAFGLVDGTSFGTPMVTGALIQLATHYATFDAQTLKTRLLDRADQVPALNTTVELGRVLNTTSATDFTQQMVGGSPNNPPTGSTEFELANTAVNELMAYPNPFRQSLNVQIPAQVQGTAATLTIRDQLGRSWYTQRFSEIGNELQLQSTEIGQLPAGMYYLQLENNQHATTLLLNKQ